MRLALICLVLSAYICVISAVECFRVLAVTAQDGECQELLPSAVGGKESLHEGLFCSGR